MTTSETQARIINQALSLFNEHGVKAISVNYIADSLSMSRGNLHYHFRTKDDLIAAIFDRLSAETAASSVDDRGTPTLAHMRAMFERYMDLIWRYRFFFRELTALLNRNPPLRRRYAANRDRRMGELSLFFEGLVAAGVMRAPAPPVTLEALLKLSWMACDNWLAYVEAGGHALDRARVQEGFDLVMCLFAPYISTADVSGTP